MSTKTIRYSSSSGMRQSISAKRSMSISMTRTSGTCCCGLPRSPRRSNSSVLVWSCTHGHCGQLVESPPKTCISSSMHTTKPSHDLHINASVIITKSEIWNIRLFILPILFGIIRVKIIRLVINALLQLSLIGDLDMQIVDERTILEDKRGVVERHQLYGIHLV